MSLDGTQYFNSGVTIWARCECDEDGQPCYELMRTLRDWRELVNVLHDVASRECSCRKRVHLEFTYLR